MQTNRHRRGLTYLELMMAVTVMGILSTVALARFGKTFLEGSVGLEMQCRRTALALEQAKRLAILSGDDCGLKFVDANSDGLSEQFSVVRYASSGTIVVDGPYTYPTNGQPYVDGTICPFRFDGTASQGYSIGWYYQKEWGVEVTLLGFIRVNEL